MDLRHDQHIENGAGNTPSEAIESITDRLTELIADGNLIRSVSHAIDPEADAANRCTVVVFLSTRTDGDLRLAFAPDDEDGD